MTITKTYTLNKKMKKNLRKKKIKEFYKNHSTIAVIFPLVLIVRFITLLYKKVTDIRKIIDVRKNFKKHNYYISTKEIKFHENGKGILLNLIFENINRRTDLYIYVYLKGKKLKYKIYINNNYHLIFMFKIKNPFYLGNINSENFKNKINKSGNKMEEFLKQILSLDYSKVNTSNTIKNSFFDQDSFKIVQKTNFEENKLNIVYKFKDDNKEKNYKIKKESYLYYKNFIIIKEEYYENRIKTKKIILFFKELDKLIKENNNLRFKFITNTLEDKYLKNK